MEQAAAIEAKLQAACLSLLQQHPQGLSEYELLKRLCEGGEALLNASNPGDELGLFQNHFLLFHSLYRLQQRLHSEESALLSISALSISLEPYRAGDVALCQSDPLRDYYLDLGNLESTTEDDVNRLLNDFWRRMLVGEPGRIADALLTLEMAQAESFVEVKQQYRRLVMRDHPDRGGASAQMQSLNEALEVMRLHFGA